MVLVVIADVVMLLTSIKKEYLNINACKHRILNTFSNFRPIHSCQIVKGGGGNRRDLSCPISLEARSIDSKRTPLAIMVHNFTLASIQNQVIETDMTCGLMKSHLMVTNL